MRRSSRSPSTAHNEGVKINRRQFLKAAGFALVGTPVLSAVTGGIGNVWGGGAKVPLKIGYLPITDHLVMLAAEREELKTANLTPVKFSSWPDISEALKTGALDGAFLLTPIGLTLRQKGVPIKVVLLGHRNGSVITVKAGNAINKVEDLKGRTLAIPSPFSTHNILLRKILAEKRIDPSRELKVIDMAPPEMPVALATGRIDGYIVAEPFGAQAEAQKVGKILVLSKDIWQDHICCVLHLRESVVASHPEAVQDLVSGFVRTAAFIERDPKAAAAGSTKLFGQKPEIIEKVLTSPKDRLSFLNLVPARADFEATQDYMIKFGISKEKVDLATFLDDSFARKAL